MLSSCDTALLASSSEPGGFLVFVVVAVLILGGLAAYANALNDSAVTHRPPVDVQAKLDECERQLKDIVAQSETLEQQLTDQLTKQFGDISNGIQRHEAWTTAVNYYQENRRYVEALLPVPLLNARLHKGIQDTTSPADAWAVVTELLMEMRDIVLDAQVKEASESLRDEARQRKVSEFTRRIEEDRRQLTLLEQSPLKADIEDEILALTERIRRTEVDRAHWEHGDPESVLVQGM
jgi:hypothetical protein